VFSQTKLEQAVISELNEYRSKHGLVALVYDERSSNMSKYHAAYLNKLNEFNYLPLDLNSNQVHDELIDLPNFIEMTFEERVKKVEHLKWLNEICIQCAFKHENDQEAAKSIINTFHNSPGHREVMLTYFNAKILDRVTPIVSLSVLEIETDSTCSVVVNINVGYSVK
jgi:hypothetical protein